MGAGKLNVAEKRRDSMLTRPVMVLASILLGAACSSGLEVGERVAATGPLRPSVSNLNILPMEARKQSISRVIIVIRAPFLSHAVSDLDISFV